MTGLRRDERFSRQPLEVCSQNWTNGVPSSTPVDMEQLDGILKATPDPHEIGVDVDKDETTIVDANGVVTKIPGQHDRYGVGQGSWEHGYFMNRRSFGTHCLVAFIGVVVAVYAPPLPLWTEQSPGLSADGDGLIPEGYFRALMDIFGNGYAAIIRDGSGKVVGLKWLHPAAVGNMVR